MKINIVITQNQLHGSIMYDNRLYMIDVVTSRPVAYFMALLNRINNGR